MSRRKKLFILLGVLVAIGAVLAVTVFEVQTAFYDRLAVALAVEGGQRQDQQTVAPWHRRLASFHERTIAGAAATVLSVRRHDRARRRLGCDLDRYGLASSLDCKRTALLTTSAAVSAAA